MRKPFIMKVARVNTSLKDLKEHLEVIIQDVEAGRAIVEECQVDMRNFRQVIRVSTRRREA